MGGTLSIGGVTPVMNNTQLAMEFQARSLRLQIDTFEEIGQLSVELIRAALVSPGTGARFDLSA